MKLTGKTKEAFYKILMFKFSVEYYEFVISKNETLLNALIIEFFDSVGITIMTLPYATIFDLGDNLKGVDGTWSYFLYIKETHKKDGVDFKSRTEATNAAIIKANELYNSQNK